MQSGLRNPWNSLERFALAFAELTDIDIDCLNFTVGVWAVGYVEACDRNSGGRYGKADA